MKILKCLMLWFYFLLKFQHASLGLDRNLTFGRSTDVIVRNYTEKPDKHNPLYLIGKWNKYKLAIPRPVDGSNTEKNHEYDDVKLTYGAFGSIISACAEEVNKGKSSSTLFRKKIAKPNADNVVDGTCLKKMDAVAKSLEKVCYSSSDSSANYTIYEIGFEVTMKSFIDYLLSQRESLVTWHPLYKVCYNSKTLSTIYAIHKLRGTSMGTKSLRYTAGNFRQIDGTPINLDKLYTKEFVGTLFQSLFTTPNYTAASEEYFAKGHLVPDGDMAFVSWKIATYFYINVVPMWQKINNGAWKVIEGMTRNLAQRLQRNLTIYTGTYGVLKYGKTEIFLSDDLLPVPAYLWKIIHDEKENQAIALVVANDPHNKLKLKSPCLSENVPKETCLDYDWKWHKDNHATSIFCCKVETLAENVPYAPQLNGVKPLHHQNDDLN